jgi:hypothetical protein
MIVSYENPGIAIKSFCFYETYTKHIKPNAKPIKTYVKPVFVLRTTYRNLYKLIEQNRNLYKSYENLYKSIETYINPMKIYRNL